MVGKVIFLIGKPRVEYSFWKGNLWHVAIFYNELIFERNSFQKNICPFSFWEFKSEPSVIVTNVEINQNLLYSQIDYSIDCATYVARVVGMDKETLFTNQKNKEIYPIDILNWLISKEG